LIAGGVGAAPLAAIAREALAREPETYVAFIYGASARERAIFADNLDALAAAESERFVMHWVLERAPADYAGARGRLDEAGAGPTLDRLGIASFDRIMISGPDAMRASVREALERRGADPSCVIEEGFVSPRRAAASTATQAATLVAADGEERTIVVAPGQTLLEAVLDAGEAISFSCLSGGCGACGVSIIEHTENVLLDEPNDVSEERRRRGEVPACLVRPSGPLRFRIG
jgi:ferredoxin-NADP reductase